MSQRRGVAVVDAREAGAVWVGGQKRQRLEWLERRRSLGGGLVVSSQMGRRVTRATSNTAWRKLYAKLIRTVVESRVESEDVRRVIGRSSNARSLTRTVARASPC